MSIVGTRPPTLDEWNKYELHHRARLAIKPGITGMWQVSGRSEIIYSDDYWHIPPLVRIVIIRVKLYERSYCNSEILWRKRYRSSRSPTGRIHRRGRSGRD